VEPQIGNPRYYYAHFCAIVSELRRTYDWLPQSPEGAWLDDFFVCTEDAQCLYLRLAGRRPEVFRFTKLRYPELDLLPAAQTLLDAGFITNRLEEDHHATQWLESFTKPELLKSIPSDQRAEFKTCGKADLVLSMLASAETLEPAFATLGEELVLIQSRILPYRKLLYYYFGNFRDGLSEFVIQELGHVRVDPGASAVNESEASRSARSRARFSSHNQAEDSFLAKETAWQIYRWLQEGGTDEAEAWLDAWFSVPRQPINPALRSLDKAILKLARCLEREKRYEDALELYGLTPRSPSRERRARILRKLDREDEAQQLLSIMQKSGTPEEKVFAIDFSRARAGKAGATQPKRTQRVANELLKKSEIVLLPKPEPGVSIEVACVEFLRQRGETIFYTENRVWKSLVGLLTWELVFDPERGKYHALERWPEDLFEPHFFAQQAEAVAERLAIFKAEPKERVAWFEAQIETHRGQASPLVNWHQETLDAVICLVRFGGGASLFKVCRLLLGDLRGLRRGFPDCMRLVDDQIDFREIKGPNDQLSNQQVFWLRELQAAGFGADVWRIQWSEPSLFPPDLDETADTSG